jgi:subtilisin family serine protease
MNRALIQRTAISLFLVFCFFLSNSQDPYRAGVIHVKLKEGYESQVSTAQAGRLGIKEVDQIGSQVGTTSIKRIFRESGNFEKAHQKFGLHLWYEIRFDERQTLAEVVKQYNALGFFQLVEPCLKYELVKPSQNSSTPPKVNSSFPGPTNDPLFSQQWHYNNTGQSGGTPGADISLPQAWAEQAGATNVIVAVIDGGIDITHPDLSGAMWVNADEIAGNNIDDDNNGYIDDVNGYGFGDNIGAFRPHYHGTHVGGTIGAVTNNGVGVSGIAGGSGSANGVRLMSCAGFGDFGVGGFEDAMVYAADNGAVISQNSWGGGSTAIEAAIDYFVARAGYDNSDANFDDNIQTGPLAGGIVIFAAGNSSTDNPSVGYPASYSPVMAVASTDHNDVRSYFSNYGSWVDIAAPGSDVYSTYPVSSGNYAYLSGTSMACPHVSGVAALIISEFGGPSFFSSLVWDRLRETADDISTLNPGFETKLGAGRVNAFQALQVADSIPPANITNLAVQLPKLTSVVLQWTATGASGIDGSASAYEIRYSTAPITSANFSAATLVTGVPKPKVSGSVEQVEVKNLSHSTTYYFALKSRDFFGNISGLSNVVSAATLLPPVIEVTPLSLTENLFTGGTSIQNVTIRNTGASELTIEVSASSSSISGASLKRAGEKIQLAYAPQSNAKTKVSSVYTKSLSGQSQNAKQNQERLSAPPAVAGAGRLFILNLNGNSIDELNPSTGAVIRSFAPPEAYYGGPEGLAFDGEFIYYVSGFGSNTVYRINPETGVVVSTLATSLPAIDALGHSGGLLYAMDYSNSVIREIDFDNGTILRTINPGVQIGAGLTFGGSRGTLFVGNFGGQVFEIDLESGEILNSFSTPGVNYGLGYSEGLGLLLAANASSSMLEAYDPDNGSLMFSYSMQLSSAIASDESGSSWLDIDGSEFSIAPAEEIIVPVLFNATDLNGGSYTGEIAINSNDPVTPLVTVPTTLHVTGAPNLDIETDSIDFGDRYATGSYDTAILIHNTGTDLLTITTLASSNPVFTISEGAPFSIGVNESVEIHLVFTPPSLGLFEGVMTIVSNDPDQGSLEIPILGRAVAPPVIDVNPESFEVTLFTDETSTADLTIQNIGEADLHYYLELITDPTTENVLNAYVPKRSEIITENNTGEKVKSFVFDEPQAMEAGDFTALASSPAYLTAFTADPTTGIIYAQQNEGYNFYKYLPASNAWVSLTACPINSGNNGGAAYLNGKIYTSYTGNDYSIGIYTIATNTWNTVTLSNQIASGNIESDGTYIYLATGYGTFLRYDPILNSTTVLASPPFTFYPWGGLSYLDGVLYGHQGNSSTSFAKYTISTNSWTLLPSIPGGAVLGSAIDPSSKTYFAYGSYGGNNWYAFDIEEGVWSTSAIPLFSVNDGGLAFVPTRGVSGIYFVQGEQGIGFGRFETSGHSGWLTATPTSGVVSENSNQAVQVTFDATDLNGGTYTGRINVLSNDPINEEIEIPVTLHVIGAPNISIDRDSIFFGEVFVNHAHQENLEITNTGTDVLSISSIGTSSPFLIAFAPITLEPGESYNLNISFSPLAAGVFNRDLIIESNDPSDPVTTVHLEGKGVLAPVIGVTPSSLSASLFTGQQQTKTLTINNTGGSTLNWNLSIENSGSNSLNDILESLNNNYAEITATIPSRYNFSEGEFGSGISDGGDDMYDGGNYLSTSLGGNLNYTQGSIATSSLLGSGGSYFTMKYPGLFVMAADMNVSYFEINGDLGADGGGTTNATVLTASVNGKNYKGFVKRVYNAGDPSVNHLIIVEDVGSIGHEYSTYTNSDFHRIAPMSGLTRVYYLLFARNSGGLIDNTAMQNIMNTFLTESNVGIGWLQTNKESGSIGAGQSEVVNVTFNAAGLDGGIYTSTLNVSSNDPNTPEISVPATLTVTGAPDIALSKTFLNFQEVYVGGSEERFFSIHNAGSAILTVSSITVSNAAFTVSPSSVQINPRDSVRVYVHFNPTEVGSESGTVRILSNDSDENDISISVVGSGIHAPRLVLTPENIDMTIVNGDRKYVKVKLINTGGGQLDWYLDPNNPFWTSVDVTSGYLFAGQEQNVTFTIDSRGISNSVYNWQAYLYTNDPLRSFVYIPFTITVTANNAPQIIQQIEDVEMEMGESVSEVEINLADYFADPDMEVLRFYAQCDSTNVALTSLSGSVLTISSGEVGSTDVFVVAEDGLGETAAQSFKVRVGSVITGAEDLLNASKLISYPNPFEESTRISFNLRKQATVSLQFYDVTGRDHYLIQNKQLDAGDHEVELGENLVSGVYVCRLLLNGVSAGSVRVIKK